MQGEDQRVANMEEIKEEREGKKEEEIIIG